MSETKTIFLFDGRVTKETLPAFRPGESSADIRIKRLLLAQGDLSQIYDGARPDQGLLYLATMQLLRGQMRGNHYHHAKREWFYLISGSMRLVVRDRASGERRELLVAAGDRIYLAPEVEHALLPLEAGFAVEYSTEAFDPGDTFRAELLSA